MQQILKTRLKKIKQISTHWTKNLSRGLEKELLRIDEKGCLSSLPHPKALGASLTHPYITTDYSESLLELITPPKKDRAQTLDFLLDLHAWTSQNVSKKDLLWTHSMPSYLPKNSKIPIAEYGSSNKGKMGHIYRKGLDLRYGRSMQTISGLHYNFSMPKDFWDIWRQIRTSEDPKFSIETQKDLASDGYFALIRNFRRYSWIILYLFGATPSLDKSFARNIKALEKLEKFGKNSYGLPYSTSLRMSSLGYQNLAQSSLSVCFNSLEEYTKSLMLATSTLYPEYAKKGVLVNDQYLQLNANLLQIENEFYSDIRPKRTSPYLEQPSKSLMRYGVEYIEVRNLDINPFILGGIDEETMVFLDLFLLFCMLSKSDTIQEEECSLITENRNKISLFGRNKKLKLEYLNSCKTLEESGVALMAEIKPLADFLDQAEGSKIYTQALNTQIEKFKNPSLTPAYLWLEFSREKGFLSAGLELAIAQTQTLRAREVSAQNLALFKELSSTSIESQLALEADKSQSFADYLKKYFA